MSISNPSENPTYWRKCTTCKKLVGFGQKYWICSVSTCNRVRTDLVFCDLRCFDAHVPVMNHRDAGAFERVAPTQKAFMQALKQEEPQRAVSGQEAAKSSSPKSASPQASVADGDEILVVVSKVKGYIRSSSGMNTSDAVMDLLSDRIRRLADLAIASAERNGRKTVLDRDIDNC